MHVCVNLALVRNIICIANVKTQKTNGTQKYAR